MALSTYPAFDVKIDNDDGTTTPCPTQTIKVYDVTNAVALAPDLVSDASGVVQAGTLAVASGTLIRFSFSRADGICGYSEVYTGVTNNYALASFGSVASATNSHSNPLNSPAQVINGARIGNNDVTGFWSTDGVVVPPQSLTIDFGQVRAIREIDVFQVQDTPTNWQTPTLSMVFTLYGIQDFNLQYWDGAAWQPVTGGSVVGTNKVWLQFFFATINTSKIKLTSTKTVDGTSRLAEIEAWS
jgi:hypothetical protein